jgi:PTH1 family peptidyl-tRNA hydrolase
MSITLVAGLGNPGAAYALTRHNIAWRVLDRLAAEENLSWQKTPAFAAEVARWARSGLPPVLLAKPLTFMNESGRSVAALAAYYKLPVGSVAVVHDEVALPLGRVKVTVGGGAGGHNGVDSLIRHLGPAFPRSRIGVGPKEPPLMDLKDFVLGRFTPEQEDVLTTQLTNLVAGLRLLITSGTAPAMNQLNRKDNHEP